MVLFRSFKRKSNGLTKNSKASVIKSKNRKYFNVKDFKGMKFEQEAEKLNPHIEYMDQMRRKQRYTDFYKVSKIHFLPQEQIQDNKITRSGKLNSFNGICN